MTIDINLEGAVKRLHIHGPDRVVINDEGEAVSMKRLPEGISWDVIFIRSDGWTLGAPSHLIDVAEAIWQDLWIAVYSKKQGLMLYQDWRKPDE